MHYVFGAYSLYPDRAELTGPDGTVRLEPKAFAVLRHLVENHDRMVSREEMIEVVWGGRFISDAAVSTALKFARKAVGDDGERQEMIRTVHGLGHRFISKVERRVDATTVVQAIEPLPEQTDRRPTIAVLAFAQGSGDTIQVGEGLADEIIGSLSRLRWLRVIARETTFRFRPETIDLNAVRSLLGAGYAMTGRVELVSARLYVVVTLIDTASGSVVWSDRFEADLDDLHLARQEIVAAIIGALDLQIPLAEAHAARGKPVEMLDAWGAYHLGMSHLYRFNARDNAIAGELFERATQLDPTMAHGFAAWSFAKFQDAMQAYRPDRASVVREARRLAERSVEIDPFDPFANMTMGRVSMMEGDPDSGVDWLDRAIRLSPSFSKGHYSLGLIDMLAGRSVRSRLGVDQALRLSPLDPLLAPMLSVRSMTYIGEGELDAAREWALRAARTNPAHFHVVATAAAICHLTGDGNQARHWAEVLHDRRPDATVGMYFRGMPFADDRVITRLRGALKAIGLPD